MVVAAPIRLGCYCRFVCTPDLSPCEAFLPVFLIGAKYGWIAFALLSAILAIGTVAGMVVFTWVTLAGVEKLRFRPLEKFESGILGGVLCLLGMLIILFER